ncbi:MAG: hypothetical protein ACRYG8_09550 [Janthinobacterium lividum]
MSGGGRAAWASPDDYTAFSLIVIALCVGLGGFMVWHTWHGAISDEFAHLARFQIRQYQAFTTSLNPLYEQLGAADPEAVRIGEIFGVLGALGGVIRTPVAIFIALLAIPCFLYAAPSRFTRKFGLSELIAEQAKAFPTIAAYADRELRLVPVRPGDPRPVDPALNPAEWIERYALDPRREFSAPLARQAFERQLGPLWQGPKKASPIAGLLFVAFALHLEGKRKEVQALLGHLAASLRDPGRETECGPETSVMLASEVIESANEWLRKLDESHPAFEIASRHAYTHTALMSLLNAARRRSGVLAPAAFNGVRLVDRSLWYALHSLGFPGDGPGQNVHPNPRIEAAGARNHWMAECLAEEPLVLPVVDAAIDAVRATLPETARSKHTLREVT